MTLGKSSPRLLVIDPDARLLQAFAARFEGEGYHVDTALNGQSGLDQAQTQHPDMVLLAARLDDMAGLDVYRALRAAPRTSHVPVMVLAGRSDMLLQNTLLEAGAYDVIEKPVDMDILGLRVRNALRRSERESVIEPRTGLPTGRLIRERLDALAREKDWCRLDVTVREFSIFRDLYGFVAANEALRFAGNLIAQFVTEHGNAGDFVGHYAGTEEFIVITSGAAGPELCNTLAERISRELHSFYNFEEREQGYVVIEDGAGGNAKRPLMSVQVRVLQPDAELGSGTAEDGAARSDAGDDPWTGPVDGDDTPDSGADVSVFDW